MIVPEFLIEDQRLGLGSISLFLYIATNPQDWRFTTAEVKKRFKCGRDSIMRALKELEDAGYIKRVFVRDTRGRITGQKIVFTL
jgi:DNA-binding MarR family transcriptional regulator